MYSACLYSILALSLWGYSYFQVVGINQRGRFMACWCLRCLSSIFPDCLSCLQWRAGLAYISQGDIVSLARTHTHHRELQQQAIGCTLPHSRQYYSAHTHHYLCQRLTVCVRALSFIGSLWLHSLCLNMFVFLTGGGETRHLCSLLYIK